jgi:transposase
MLMTFVWWPSLRPRTASRTEPKPQLTDEQWLLIADLFPWRAPTHVGGRPQILPRPCLEGILWILRSGARWKDLPTTFPSYATCWRRFRDWTRSGVWQKAWARLLRKLDGLGRIQWEEAFADGTFSPAKKGGIASARRRSAKARRS